MATKNSIIVMTMAAFLLLAGCGSNSTNDSVGAPASQSSNGGSGQGQQQGQGRSPAMAADLLGKIKSINGQTITLYKSSFVPGARGGDGQQSPNGDGQQSPQGGGQARPDMANMFSEETVDIQVTESTKIVKTTFENQQRKETVLAVSDLKVDDILNVDLEDNTQNAITLTLSDGGFGGNRGGMGGAGKGQPQQGDAPASGE